MSLSTDAVAESCYGKGKIKEIRTDGFVVLELVWGILYIRESQLHLCEQSEENVCSICFHDLFEERVARTSCGHRFHVSCLLSWLRQRNSCPLCLLLVSSLVEETISGECALFSFLCVSFQLIMVLNLFFIVDLEIPQQENEQIVVEESFDCFGYDYLMDEFEKLHSLICQMKVLYFKFFYSIKREEEMIKFLIDHFLFMTNLCYC